MALVLALQDLSLPEILQVFSRVQGSAFLLALLSVVANTAGKTWRWKVLLEAAQPKMPDRQQNFGRLALALLGGQAMNTLYPARLGDLGRAYVIGQGGLDKAYVLGTVIVEKLVDLLAYALLCLWAIFAVPLPGWIAGPLSGLIVLGVGQVAALALIVHHRAWVLVWLTGLRKRVGRFGGCLPSHFEDWLQAGLLALESLRNTSVLCTLVSWSLMIWGTAILTNYLALLALRLPVGGAPAMHSPWTAAALVLVLVQAGVILPSAPGKVGVFEYLCVLALTLLGVNRADALSYGFLLHGIVFIPSTLVGLIAVIVLSQTPVSNLNGR